MAALWSEIPETALLGVLFVAVGYLLRYRGWTGLLKGSRDASGRVRGAFFLVAGVGLLGYSLGRVADIVPRLGESVVAGVVIAVGVASVLVGQFYEG